MSWLQERPAAQDGLHCSRPSYGCNDSQDHVHHSDDPCLTAGDRHHTDPGGPAHDPASIRRWSSQRLMLTAAAALGTLILIGLFVDSSAPPHREGRRPARSGRAVAQFRVAVRWPLE